MKTFSMLIVGKNGADRIEVKAYSNKQAIGYVKRIYGFKTSVRDFKEVKTYG